MSYRLVLTIKLAENKEKIKIVNKDNRVILFHLL